MKQGKVWRRRKSEVVEKKKWREFFLKGVLKRDLANKRAKGGRPK